MCKDAPDQKSTSTVDIPAYVEAGGKKLVSLGTKAADKPFVPYTGDRVAGLNQDQTTAFQQIRNLISGAPKVLDESLAGARTYANAPAQNIETERVVDEGGRLGAISDYFNPYTEQALQPAIRKIMEAADQQRKQIGASATSSGAFGDARHGIMEGVLNRDTSQVIGDTSSQFFKSAFDSAMANRSTDLNRFLQADTTDANFDEQGLQRGFTGSGAVLDRANSDQQRQLQAIQALLSGGTQQQGNVQAGLDADYGEFLRKQGWDASLIDTLAKALGAAPYQKTQTTTQDGGKDNSLIGLGGSVAGSVLSSAPVAAALAAFI
jgi:hypothetical protein